MREIISILERWTSEGTPVSLGSVIERIGSAPRDPGATLAVSASGDVAGSVTGGCVEPAVIREATEVLNGSRGRICRYGLTDDEGFDVGLSCGGSIAVAVYLLDPGVVPTIAEAVADDSPIALTVQLGEHNFGEQRLVPGQGAGGDPVETAALRLLEIGESGIVETADGEIVFVESYAPRPDMYIFGASDHVSALVTMGKFLGYRVTVCDARATFVNEERFPGADELVVEWPDRFLETAPVDARTAICMMTHDLKFDVPALLKALNSGAGSAVVIGGRRWDRESATSSWAASKQEPVQVPAPDWRRAVDASMLGSAIRDGRPAWRVSFYDPTTPAWFELEIDKQTHLPLRLHMTAAAHFMTHTFHAFNAPLVILPPA
jgi:xanthine dehydrogenase accessory factor